MTETKIDEMMRALDPSRDVSDAVLAELSPEERLWERLDLARVRRDTSINRHRWLAVAAVAAVAALVAVLWSQTGTTPVQTTISSAQILVRAQSVSGFSEFGVQSQGFAAGSLNGRYWSVSAAPTPGQVAIRRLPLCAQSKIVETLSVARPSATTRIWHFVLILHDAGASCRVDPREWLPEGVTGPARLPIYSGWAMSTPVIPSGATAWVELHAHATWQLHFRVLSPWSTVYVTEQNSLRGPNTHICSSLLADGFVEVGMNARWKDSYFHLPLRVPVCREGLFNIQGDTTIIPKKAS